DGQEGASAVGAARLLFFDVEHRIASSGGAHQRCPGSEREHAAAPHHHAPRRRMVLPTTATSALGELGDGCAVSQRTTPPAMPRAPATNATVARFPATRASWFISRAA